MDPQRHDAITDPALDAEIRRALAVDPSPEFLARVRTRIADEPVSGSGRLSWVVVAPAVFAVALVAIIAISQRVPTRTQKPAPLVLIARFSIGTGALISPPSVAEAFRPAIAGLKPRATGVRSEPEVLLAADEMKALRQLILGIQEGRIELASALAAPPVDDIAIEPIAITPIPPMTGEQGVRQ